jgi:steroid delta-isomerase-like uncharacterized protein
VRRECLPPIGERFEKLEETLQICEQMWSHNNGPFKGKHYRLAETLCAPQPIPRPRPPILIGGEGEKETLRLVARYADVWNASPAAGPPDEMQHKLEVLNRQCDDVGRDPALFARRWASSPIRSPTWTVLSRRPPGTGPGHLLERGMTSVADEAAIAVVRRNTEQVQGKGNWELFDELFADNFVDHTPQPGMTPDKAGVRQLYQALRTAFPDFHADIQWQIAADNLVTTYKIYHGTQTGPILGVAPTGRTVEFETVDVMKVVDGKITDHWGVGNLLKMMVQLGAVTLNA